MGVVILSVEFFDIILSPKYR